MWKLNEYYMGKLSIITRIKLFIGGIGWKLFLWGNGFTDEEYWEQIYEQEKRFREKYNDYED